MPVRCGQLHRTGFLFATPKVLVLSWLMRPKFVFFLLLLVFLVVAAAVLLQKNLSPDKLKPESAAPSVVAPAAVPPPALPAPVAVPAVVKILTPEERQAAINAEKEQLYTWSMNDDSQSLSNILSALTSPEKEVRLAAIEATKQFGSTNAIPVLKAVAASSDDTQEQIAMLEAADFISLPDAIFASKGGSQVSLTQAQIQAREQSKAKAEARRQAYLQIHHPDQNTQSTPENSPATAPGN